MGQFRPPIRPLIKYGNSFVITVDSDLERLGCRFGVKKRQLAVNLYGHPAFFVPMR